jgi:ComF family protein
MLAVVHIAPQRCRRNLSNSAAPGYRPKRRLALRAEKRYTKAMKIRWPLRAGIRRLAVVALDLLLPPHCPACDAEVPVQGTFCPACFAALNFITEPLCHACGLPFASSAQGGMAHTCPTCSEHPPLWREARAAFLYDDAARRLILPFKHANRQEIATVLATHMARAGRGFLNEAHCIVPVPLHRWRLFRRGFNQAALLARALGKRSGVPSLPDALRRRRRTPLLGPLSAAQRAKALQGVFDIRPSRIAALYGKHILLVDDVMTSGATANACAETLLQAGCAGVDVLVAARVPDPRQALLF